jgi:mycothiol synthase
VNFTIREFDAPADYAGFADMLNALMPHNPTVPADWIEHDERMDDRCRMQRWVAVNETGMIVGVGQYAQYVWTYHPRKFNLWVRVHPDYQRQGIGTALYDIVIAAVEAFDPITLWSGSSDRYPAGLRFAAQRGFAEKARFSESHLDLAALNTAPYIGVEARLQNEGIELLTLCDLADDPDRDRKLWRLDMALSKDLPGEEEIQEISFEAWYRDIMEPETTRPELYLVAVDTRADNAYVGMTQLVIDRASDMLYTGLTGVRRDYRRRGIASALKARLLTDAQSAGRYSIVKTGNEAGNDGMLNINHTLGFVPQPDNVSLIKELRAAGE